MIKNKLKISIIFLILMVALAIILAYQLYSDGDQELIAKAENGEYVLDTVDASKHPFSVIDLESREVQDINDRLHNQLIEEQIQTAKNYLLNKKDKPEGTSGKYTVLSYIEINSVIVDSGKSAKIIARLNYVNLDKDPNTIEEIPIIIDDQIITLPYSPNSNNDSDIIQADYFEDICVYIYYKDKEFHVLKEVMTDYES